MRLGRGSLALVAALAVSVVLAVLLSPLGFERRPPADLTLIGYFSIAAVAAGVLLDLVAILLIFRGVRLASILAIVGSVAFLLPSITDKAGAFFSLPAPPGISVLEYMHLAVLLVTLVVAWTVYRGSDRDRRARRDA
jgi:hypothetical protein